MNNIKPQCKEIKQSPDHIYMFFYFPKYNIESTSAGLVSVNNMALENIVDRL